ncbi:hypothetical protein [Bacteroides finegoldii]|nr:hypothetical protein [Bacteroides finegoldii]
MTPKKTPALDAEKTRPGDHAGCLWGGGEVFVGLWRNGDAI